LESTASNVASDLGLSASPLRLVKLRLMLSLVAMAVVPLAIAAPLAYSVLDGQQNADRLRAERDSTALAAAIGTRLDSTEQSVVRTATGPIMSGFLAATPKTSTATARATLLTLAASSEDGVRDIMVEDTSGSVRLWISGGKIATGSPKLPADDPTLAATLATDGSAAWESPIHPDANGAPMITISAPVPDLDPTTDTPSGIVRAEVSLSQILGSGASGLVGGSVLAQLMNQDGTLLAQARGTGALVPADGTVATAAIPNQDWRVQITEPRQSTQTPFVLIGGLAMSLLAIGALILWMARQVIKPAEELEASRGRLRELYEVARLDALRDVLTGLGNHRAFHEEFDRQLESAKRYNTPLALVLIDLDDFKLVNDTSGHAAGDELLAEMGRLTMSTIRTADRAFRIGGDEFAVLMPHTDAEGARVVGRRLLASALETRPGSSVPTSFSFSVGISGFPAFTTDKRQLYAQADSALYWAKTHGRTMVQIFDPSRHKNLGVHAANSGELGASVAEITAKRALRPVYQPVVELRNGRIIGYEALVRPTPESGFANAGELFAAAEVSGRQTELDQTCLEVVVAGAASLASETILSLNLSPRTLEAPEFSVVGLIRLLERYQITPNRVILELTEREEVDDLDRLRHNVAAARAAGLRIAADDVGAGNAGLRLLSQMQFDIVKIDLSLVQGGPQQKTSLAVISSLQELAQRWGAWVIAEGVETPEQLDLIRNLGISAAQGYLLGRPGESLEVPPVDLSSLLARDDWLHKLARAPHPLSVPAQQAS
jgi:diguanylate cyclase (GGDEF)-like protein